MLTYKAAYQVAAGLAYLHRKNIIFCDLKSDNILVWSLQEEDSVNVKLSDYGISRQSFHEGALGVEGTPGYQAPEIRPGIVYDEKVYQCLLIVSLSLVLGKCFFFSATKNILYKYGFALA